MTNKTAEIMINGEPHNDLCVGIDLGTTNSVISIINQKNNGELVSKVVDIPRAINRMNSSSGKNRLETQKKNTLPSCVYYNDENNYQPIVGDFAKDQFALRPHLVAKSIKSHMGEEYAQGLSENIPDKTPSQISSRILRHLLHYTEEIYKCGKITDAIITVPANFDSLMCRATVEAAELAGIKTKNQDGTDRAILLSEPNAAIYDFINQINCGEIPDTVLDLSSPKKVMVFDLGGGTLDITMHEIRRRGENLETLKVDEIATNRYTLLGGDNFDKAIAEEMYKRFLAKYPDVTIQQKLVKQKESLMPKFISWAEDLKKDINIEDSDIFDSNWDDDDDGQEKRYSVGGNTGSNFSYDDDFTKKEVEAILEPFMGRELVYSNYKNMDCIRNTNNIIYPILDVLAKAAAKLGDENIRPDAVILNGGMSRFYMVKDRLEEFFGFEPVSLLDPDLAVARGAAVYHHYLHKDAYLQDDMRIVEGYKSVVPSKPSESTGNAGMRITEPSSKIIWGNKILNDALFLGLKGGAVKDIIPTGASLPYDSDVMKGYRLQSGTNRISIPIKSRNIDGTYRTIATGLIEFKKTYKNGAYVAFRVHMDANKVISMIAWTCSDEECSKMIESGAVDIAIGDKSSTVKDSKIVAASGMPVNPVAAISTLLQFCQNKENKNLKIRQVAIKKLKEVETEILKCCNRNEFAEVVLQKLSMPNISYLAKERLLVLARKIGNNWSMQEKSKLASICKTQLSAECSGMGLGGMSVNVSIQAIYTLGMCGTASDFDKLKALHENSKYFQACLYVHGKTRTQLDWIFKQFNKDYENYLDGYSNNLQSTVYAVGNALKKDGSGFESGIDEESIIETICDILRSDVSDKNFFIPCVIALGLICDTRFERSRLSTGTYKQVHQLLDSLESYAYRGYGTFGNLRCRDIAIKMLEGHALTADEEHFLLEKIEVA